MNWTYRVKIKHLLNDSEEPEIVRETMAKMADALDASPAFSMFNTAQFRRIPDGDDVVPPVDYANRLLGRMYDYADAHGIWVE